MLVIGIAGGTGSGKTTVVNNILQQLNAEGVNVLSQDNYYHDNHHLSLQEREALNYDHPKSIDFELFRRPGCPRGGVGPYSFASLPYGRFAIIGILGLSMSSATG